MAIEVRGDDAVKMIEAVRFLHDETGRFVNTLDGDGVLPQEGSRAASEQAEVGGLASMTDIFIQGHFLMEGAADQMIALTRMLVEPVQTIAPWTCVRTLLESCALAAWLFDPRVDARTRLGRSFALKFEGLTGQVKYCRVAHTEAEVATFEQHIDELEARALGAGFSKVVNRNGRRDGVGQRMPSATELIGQMLSQEDVYRFLSAVTHGHLWAVQQAGFRAVASGPVVTRPVGGQTVEVLRHVEKTLSFEHAGYLCNLAVRNFALPVWYKGRLFGWETGRLVPVFERVADDVRLKNEARFWRDR